MQPTSTVSRRDFLLAGGAIVVGFSVGAALPKWAHAQIATTGRPSSLTNDVGRPLDAHEVDSFLAFHPDGEVTLYTSKVDVGTGLRITLSQMAAEELGIPVERITIVEGDTALAPDQGGTGGSSGVPVGGIGIRQAAASARQAILKLASERLQQPSEELTIDGGTIRSAASRTAARPSVTIASLIGGKRLNVAIDPKAPLRNPDSYTIVGKPKPRPDVPGKCTGTHGYLQDFTVPGMLHARVVRPPAMGATLISVDESSVRAIPDVEVVRMDNFLAVVSKDEWAAVRAARELKANWTDWQGLPGSEDLPRFVRSSAVERDQVLVKKGDPAAAFPAAPRRFSATYTWPCQSHGSLGPSCAVADVRADGATLWTSTQGTYGMRANLSRIFDIPQEKLRVIYLDGSGSYGTNGADDAAADAMILSRKLGKPVRVQWMRQDEHGWDPKGPPQVIELRAGLDEQGHIVAWETEMWLPGTVPGNRPLLGVDAAALSQPHGRGAGQVQQNGDPPYTIDNMSVTVHWLKDTPLRPSNLRAPGKIANVFAVEGFADEIASALQIDAVEFRLRGLTDPRAVAVLQRAVEMIGWQPRRSPNPQRGGGGLLTGRGVGQVHYKQAENYVAVAMEVAVGPATGGISIRRVTCAHDCGLIINPDGLRNQVEGCVVQTLSRALHEEVRFDHSRVTSVDWNSYPILTFPELPPVEVALIDRPHEHPFGAGEAATAPVAAALGNAVFDATGVRIRSAPFTPERVKAALAAAGGLRS